MNHFWQLIYDHRFSIGAGAWYIGSALIVTQPAKGEPFKFRYWFYDFTHLLLNLKPIASIQQVYQNVIAPKNIGATGSTGVSQ